MADQQLIAVHHFRFLQEKIFLPDLETCKFWKKLVYWGILIAFPLKHGSLALSIQIFRKIHPKMTSLKILRYSLNLQKRSKFWCLDFTKLQLLEKLSFLVYFDYSY